MRENWDTQFPSIRRENTWSEASLCQTFVTAGKTELPVVTVRVRCKKHLGNRTTDPDYKPGWYFFISSVKLQILAFSVKIEKLQISHINLQFCTFYSTSVKTRFFVYWPQTTVVSCKSHKLQRSKRKKKTKAEIVLFLFYFFLQKCCDKYMFFSKNVVINVFFTNTFTPPIFGG